jgi:hypothetical protein
MHWCTIAQYYPLSTCQEFSNMYILPTRVGHSSDRPVLGAGVTEDLQGAPPGAGESYGLQVSMGSADRGS